MVLQDLNGAQIRACFEQVGGKAMPQDVWIYLFLDARSLGSLLAGVPRCFRIDRLATTVPAVARKQPFAGFSRQAAPVLAQFFEQFWAEHHIAIYASLPAMDVNHHPRAIDVADFQSCQLCVACSGGVKRHEQNAMVGSERRMDELCDFFLAEDRRKVKWSFRIGSLVDAPGLLELLAVEKPHVRQLMLDGAR